MGQILHGIARMTAAVGRAIQDIQESLIALSKRHGINNDPAPDALVAASLFAAPRDQPVARSGGGQVAEEGVQDIPDRLLPHRHRPAACGGGHAGAPDAPPQAERRGDRKHSAQRDRG